MASLPRVARLVACLALAAAGVVVLQLHRRPLPPTGLASGRVPHQLGAWRGQDVPVEERTYAILETRDVVFREYRQSASDQPVWLSVVGGLNTRSAFHPPELCYVGSHYEVAARGRRPLDLGAPAPGTVTQLVVRDAERELLVWYWFTAGGRSTSDYLRQQWWLAMDAVRRQPVRGRLVRVSTPVVGGDVASATSALTSFMRAAAPAWQALGDDSPVRGG